MALAEPIKVNLPAIRTSPTTLQYLFKKPNAHSRPTYPRRFYPSEEVKSTLSQPWLARVDPLMPRYPYGRNNHFVEANDGLYGGSVIQSGNKISKGRNKGKTLRKWYPNVRVEKLESKALAVTMNIPTTARTMRTIRKCGGLDEYLLGEKPARIKELGLLGWKLRWLVLKSKTVTAQHARERKKLGLTKNQHSVTTSFAQAWTKEEFRKEIMAKMNENWAGLTEKFGRLRSHARAAGIRTTAAPAALHLQDPARMGLDTLRITEKRRRRPQVPDAVKSRILQNLKKLKSKTQRPRKRTSWKNLPRNRILNLAEL